MDKSTLSTIGAITASVLAAIVVFAVTDQRRGSIGAQLAAGERAENPNRVRTFDAVLLKAAAEYERWPKVTSMPYWKTAMCEPQFADLLFDSASEDAETHGGRLFHL